MTTIQQVLDRYSEIREKAFHIQNFAHEMPNPKARVRRLNYELFLNDEKFNAHLPYVCKRKIYMAKQTKTEQSYFDYEMVNIRLSGKDLDRFDKWVETQSVEMDEIQLTPLQHGYKVSTKLSEKGDLFYISYTGDGKHPENPKRTLTSFSSDYYDAHRLNFYKAFILCEGQSWDTDEIAITPARG